MTQVVFHALDDVTRRELVSRLSREGPLAMGHLTAGLRMSRQAAAKHVAVLKGAGLVRLVPRGRESLCVLCPEPFREVVEWLERIGADWDVRRAEFKRLVDGL